MLRTLLILVCLCGCAPAHDTPETRQIMAWVEKQNEENGYVHSPSFYLYFEQMAKWNEAVAGGQAPRWFPGVNDKKTQALWDHLDAEFHEKCWQELEDWADEVPGERAKGERLEELLETDQ